MAAVAQKSNIMLFLLALTALLQGIASQSSSSGSTVTATLAPMQIQLFKITTLQKQVNGQTLDPDIQVQLTVLTGGHAGLYCSPGWLAGTPSSTNFPNPNNAVYASDNSKGINLITISRVDSTYRPPANFTSYQPTFICAVISMEAARSIDISWSYTSAYASPVLVASEAAAVQAIYNQCCGQANDTSKCPYWKALNAAQGQMVTNLCSFSNQACSPKGNLQTLDLSNTGLTCTFPSQAIQQFGSLQSLVLGSNPGLTGDVSGILEGLSGLSNLLEVYLQSNTGLTGQLSSGTSQGACALPESLDILAIQNTSLSGSLPSCIFTNSTIYNIHLDANSLSGSIPDNFSDSSYLQVLTLSRNKLTGSFPSSISNANALYALDLSYNNLAGTIPAGLGDLPMLQSVILRNNALSGTVPSSLVTNPNLEDLVLLNNQFTALGSSWVNASASSLVNSTMYVIILESNKIKGSFPQAVAFMPKLQGISLANNSFSGTLPSSSSMFSNLLALNISRNSFNGSIPSQMGEMAGFQGNVLSSIVSTGFDVSNNQLSGSLPAFLVNSSVPSSMRSNVRLAGNKLTSDCGNTSYLYVPDLQQQCQTLTAPAPAPVSPATTPAQAPATSPAAAVQQAAGQQKGSSSLSGGAVAGIVVGVLLALLVAAGLFLASSKHRRERALASLPGRQQSGFGHAARKGLSRRPSGAPFLQSNALGFARFSDADMNQDDAARGAESTTAKDFRLFGV
ncbi:hypothetical protein WJX74_010722 [Apatococcus lobatus]|uniref:Uncharacterized protein n=1 Tax=Apatococcus lobatus TaxID=904363 RepID=A0AAW1QJL3_9CHLO